MVLVALDPILEILLLIKNNWSLTGEFSPNSISWGTGKYNAEILTPQIVVTQVGGDPSPPLTTGNTDVYFNQMDELSIGIWVRPKMVNNTTLGWAKNAIYQFRCEVERIIRANLDLGLDGDGNAHSCFMGSWKRTPLIDKDPVIFYEKLPVYVVRYLRN